MRTTTPPVIDGNLDDDVWHQAPVATDFWISAYGRAPSEPTEVCVIADKEALYVAFHCFDSRPVEIHAEQLKRDSNLSFDDYVTVELDPYHNHRQISDFSVNARGTQADAMAGGRARKIEWKGDWQTAARRVADGWTAEMRIPFAILNFEPGATTFGVNFLRYHHRTQEWSQWADLTVQALNEEMGHLTGLVLPRTAKANKLTVMQYVAVGKNTPDKRGGHRDTLATTGVDVRYSIANNLTNVLSLNPDFSQVEDVVLDLAFDYNEKFRTDLRPFFQEGSAFFGDRAYFYSGRIPDFDAGVKSFGKVGPLQVGALGTTSPGGRQDYVARVLRELGSTTNIAFTAVGTRRDSLDNDLFRIETDGRIRRNVVFSANLASTSTNRLPGLNRAGSGLNGNLSWHYEWPYWQAGMSLSSVDTDYFPANGFIANDVLGTRAYSLYTSYYRDYDAGVFRNLNGSITYGKRDTMTGLLQNRSTAVYVSAETRADIQVNLGATIGPYRPRGENPGEWSGTINQDRFYTSGLYFNTRSDRLGYGLTYSWGRLGGGPYSDLLPSIWWKPTLQTYLSYSFERTDSFGVTEQNILSLSWEPSPEQAFSARWLRYDGEFFGGDSYRLAYRRQVRRGLDIFAIFSTEPDTPNRSTLKLTTTY